MIPEPPSYPARAPELPGPSADFDMRSAASATYRRWVLVGSAIAAVGYLTMASSFGLTDHKTAADAWWELASGLCALAGFVLAWNHRVTAASLLVVSALLIEPHVSIYLRGELVGAAVLVFPGVTVAAGLLLGRRASWAVAFGATGSTILAAWFGKRAGNGPPGFESGEISMIIVSSFILLGLAAILHVAVAAFREALRQAQESSARFERLVADAPDGIVELDDADRVVSTNPKGAWLLLGGTGDPVGESLDTLLLSTESIRLSEWLAARARGTLRIRLAQRVVEVTGRQIVATTSGGSTQLMLRDVTEREAAAQQASELSRVLRETPAEVVVFDAFQGGVLLTSKGFRTSVGMEEEELAGQPVSVVIPGLGAEGLAELRRRIAAAPTRTIRIPGLHRRADGSAYPTESEFAPAEFDGRSVLIAFVTDMTERVASQREQQQLQRQLEHAQKMEAVGHLAGGIAHDFNNLLTVVGGSAEVLREDVPSDLVELVDEILQAGERGQVLIRRLLTFARKEIAQPAVVDLGEVVALTEVLSRRLAGEQVVVEFEREANLPPVLLDAGQVEQVVLNLVSNARDAMPSGGTVCIRVDSPEDRSTVRLTVSDDGPGIPPEIRAHLFEPFFTTKPSGKGTGLGLATVHGIVTQSGGTIEVESEVDVGSSFRIEWPACEERASSESEPAPRSASPVGELRVLYVEDYADTRALVSRLLRRAGHEVHVAEHAEAALALPMETLRSVDVIVTDVVMPGISGIRMVEQLRELRVTAPALYVSGYLDEGVHGSIPGDARHGLLLKPFSGAALNERISELVLASGEPSNGKAVPEEVG